MTIYRVVSIMQEDESTLFSKPVEKCHARFHQFTTVPVKIGDLWFQRPVAIVELENGSIEMIDPKMIKFIGRGNG